MESSEQMSQWQGGGGWAAQETRSPSQTLRTSKLDPGPPTPLPQDGLVSPPLA